MIAIGRMCSLSDTLNGKLAQPDLMAEAVKTVQNAASPALLKAGIFLIQSSAANSADAARLAVDAGAVQCLCERLEDTDAGTKAAAAWGLGAIASHDGALAAKTGVGIDELFVFSVAQDTSSEADGEALTVDASTGAVTLLGNWPTAIDLQAASVCPGSNAPQVAGPTSTYANLLPDPATSTSERRRSCSLVSRRREPRCRSTCACARRVRGRRLR